jgi:peptide/nickel transport system permease protein
LGKYVLRRIALAAPTLIGITMVVFGAVRFLPGNVLDSLLGVDAPLVNAETRAEMEKRYGFNQNIAQQYLVWWADMAQGNLGPLVHQRPTCHQRPGAAHPRYR